MRAFLLMFVMFLSVPMVAQAQVKPEIRPFVGLFVPTGDQRHVFNNALLTGAQLAVEATDVLHLVGTFAFTKPDVDNASLRSGRMHVYQSDVGAELFRDVALNNEWKLRPFFGAGLGVRTYDPTAAGAAKNYAAGYGAVGAELQRDRLAVRFETRDYLTAFKGFAGNEESSTRNEVALNLGLAYHLK